ncbi:MAG: 30S ribosomal protein S9 [Desulfobacterota bacterium]|nr:30S ribosomal protein S9 [Thermodesulfobacteriota bacterium]
MEGKEFFATGRRKTSVARIWMEPGNGTIMINNKSIDDYFGGHLTKKEAIKTPLKLTNTISKYNVWANVSGGGITGQAEAIRHGIARTLIKIHPELKTILKKASLLTRDPRVVERKKYGQVGARKRFQYSKR